jgi:hypothetical protein
MIAASLPPNLDKDVHRPTIEVQDLIAEVTAQLRPLETTADLDGSIPDPELLRRAIRH